MLRAAVEGLLGIEVLGGTRLRVTAALPDDRPGYRGKLLHSGRVHELAVTRDGDAWRVTLNGQALDKDGTFPLQ